MAARHTPVSLFLGRAVPVAGVGAPPSAGLSWGAMTAIPFPDAIMRNAESVAVRLA